MSVYVPRTMIGRAALAAWHQSGKEETCLRDVEAILRRIRDPDMELVRRVGLAIGVKAATVDLCWARMIDAILAEAPAEDRAMMVFGGAIAVIAGLSEIKDEAAAKKEEKK